MAISTLRPIANSSLPTRERGLKEMLKLVHIARGKVAPYTGAWIESALTTASYLAASVAPYTGAWIERRNIQRYKKELEGRSLHGSVD